MKKCFKLTAMVLALLFTLTMLLTGCVGKKVSGGKDEGAQKKDVVIKFYTESDDVTNKSRKFPEFIFQYEKRNPGVKIEMAPLVASFDYDEYRKKADIMIAGGDQIDIIRLATLEEVSTKAKSGVLEPLKDYAEKEGIDLGKEYFGIIPLEGKTYAIPYETTCWMIFINKDMLDDAGLPVPPRDWTWADYREYAKKLTKGEGASKVYGSYMHNWSDWFFAVGAQSKIIDNPFYTKDGKHNFGDPIFTDGLKFRNDLENVDKSQLPYSDMLSQKTAYRDVFFSGKAAMTPMGAWMVSDIQRTEKYPHTFKTTFAAYPRWDESCEPNTCVLDGSGSGWSINAKSRCKEETYKFLRAMTTEGFDYGCKLWSPWKKSNMEAIIKGIAGSDESFYDMKAMKEVMFDPDRVENSYTFVGPGQGEVLDAWTQESETYLTGGQTLEKAIENIKKRADEITAKAK